MKKIYLLLLFGIISNVQSQTPLSNTDKDQLIQKCLEFQPLVDKIPAEAQAMMAEYYILGNNVEADFSQDLIVNGKKISFLSKADLSPEKPFFDFFTLNVVNDKAFVRYYFTYTTNGKKTTIPITIDFVKTNSVWQVLQHTI
jgi:hypothetical protein